MLQAGRHEEALRLLRRAVDLGMPDDLLFRTLWDIGTLEKRLGRTDAALAMFTDLAASRNAYRARALRELAIYYEHRERNYAMALEMTRSALALEDSAELAAARAALARARAAPFEAGPLTLIHKSFTNSAHPRRALEREQ